MNLPVFNPILASSALSAFRAQPETGLLSVPLLSATTVRSQVLCGANVLEASVNLLALSRAPDEPAEPWQRSPVFQPPRAHFENASEGRALHIEVGSMQANGLADSAQGLLVSCRRLGVFGGAAMTVAWDPHKRRPPLSRLYDLEWIEAGLFGLKKILGWEEDLPVHEVAMRLFRHLGLLGDPNPRNAYEELGEESLQSEWAGTHPNGTFVTILAGPDDALYDTYGDIAERLRFEILPAGDHPEIPESLLSLWNSADEVSADSNSHHRQDAVAEGRARYREWVKRVYGENWRP